MDMFGRMTQNFSDTTIIIAKAYRKKQDGSNNACDEYDVEIFFHKFPGRFECSLNKVYARNIKDVISWKNKRLNVCMESR